LPKTVQVTDSFYI